MLKYVWCEDQGAGFKLWTEVFNVIDSDITVVTKKGISDLRKAAERINEDGNAYYLIIDTALDNNDIRREIRKLQTSCKSKSNVFIIGFHSFEYIILSFEHLGQWLFNKNAIEDNKAKLLMLKDKFVNIIKDGGNLDDLAEIKTYLNYPENKNTEHLAARLLRDITKGTVFSTDKGHLGECFVNDCCTAEIANEEKKCGLIDNYLNKEQKIKDIVEKSVIVNELNRVGLYK